MAVVSQSHKQTSQPSLIPYLVLGINHNMYTSNLHLLVPLESLKLTHLQLPIILHPPHVLVKAVASIHEWSIASNLVVSMNTLPLPPERWTPLPPANYKLDFNGSINYTKQFSGISGIIREHDGCIVTAFSSRSYPIIPFEPQFIKQRASKQS